MTVGSRAQVFHGNATETSGGLKKKDLKLVKGEIISRKKAKDSKANPWIKAVSKARKELIKSGDLEKGVFAPIKGPLLTRARELYKK